MFDLAKCTSMKRLHGKISSRHYKRGIPPGWDETFQMQSQDIIYEEIIILPESRQRGTEFHPGQPGSHNHRLRCSLLKIL